MNLTYRPINQSDIDALYEVRMSVLENQIADQSMIPRELVVEVLNDGGSYACLHQEHIVGFSMATASGSIFALFVRPEYEGKGIGKTLLNMMLDYLKTKGVSKATLTTQPKSRADQFYQLQGWIRGEINTEGDVEFHYDLNKQKAK